MKKIIKNNMFGFILGGLIFGCIGIYGVNSYQSNAIEYSPTDSSWNVSNVNDALNDLHSNIIKAKIKEQTVTQNISLPVGTAIRNVVFVFNQLNEVKGIKQIISTSNSQYGGYNSLMALDKTQYYNRDGTYYSISGNTITIRVMSGVNTDSSCNWSITAVGI